MDVTRPDVTRRPTRRDVARGIATSIAAWANAILLGYWLHRRGHFSLPAADWVRHGLIIVASVAMAVALYALAIPLTPFFTTGAHLIVQLIALTVLVTVGLVVYFALVHFTGAQPLGLLLRRLKRTG